MKHPGCSCPASGAFAGGRPPAGPFLMQRILASGNLHLRCHPYPLPFDAPCGARPSRFFPLRKRARPALKKSPAANRAAFCCASRCRWRCACWTAAAGASPLSPRCGRRSACVKPAPPRRPGAVHSSCRARRGFAARGAPAGKTCRWIYASKPTWYPPARSARPARRPVRRKSPGIPSRALIPGNEKGRKRASRFRPIA